MKRRDILAIMFLLPLLLIASGCETIVKFEEVATAVSYQAPEVSICPTTNGDYIAVSANPTVGTTSEFCVAQYEMKDVGGVATSQATGDPWISISQVDSRTACSNLGAGYALISNEEWMTIAREIEMTNANWSNGSIGDGHLNRGWSARTADDGFQNSAVAPSTDANCTYNTAADTCGSTGNHKLKRTHTLANGEIWDFAGNVWEFVDWNVTPANKAYDATDGSPQAAWREWTLIDTNINNGDEMETITWQTTDPSLNSTQNIGQYYSGLNSSGGAAFRSGSWNIGTLAGAFTLHLSLDSTSTAASIGFRCVFRP